MRQIKILYTTVLFFLLAITLTVRAQDKDEAVSVKVKVSATVTDLMGAEMAKVMVFATQSGNTVFTNSEGQFEIETNNNDFIVFTHFGYEKEVVEVINGEILNQVVVMKKWGVINPNQEISIAHNKLPFERLTGAVERITGDELKDYPTHSLHEALAGRLSGVTSFYGQASPENEGFYAHVRGGGFGAVYVNGVPSGVTETANEIDDIIIAKDLSSTLLYGIDAGGAMLINTKKGTPGEKLMTFKVRTGLRHPTFLPDMMNASAFAQAYNKALENDGLPAIYGAEDIAAYEAGNDKLRYPNHDYYTELVDDPAVYKHVTGDFSGGSKKVRYFSHLGYYGTSGTESVGDGRSYDRIRVRNNVDVQFSEFGKLTMGIGGSFSKRKGPDKTGDYMFNKMYNYPANAMPYFVNDSVYAKSRNFDDNLRLILENDKIMEDNRRDGYTQIGLDLDLGTIADGLTYSGMVSMYIYSNISKVASPQAAQAEPVFTQTDEGLDTLVLINETREALASGWSKKGDVVIRSQYISNALNYNRKFNENNLLSANLVYAQREETGNELIQSRRLRNIGFKANYMYNKKYVFDFNLVNSAIRQLKKEERNKVFYSVGGAWLMHKESFIKKHDWINFLKLRANYGVVGRRIEDYFLFQTQYKLGGYSELGIVGKTNNTGGYIREITGAEELVFPKMSNLTVGLDYQLFDGHLNGQLNYFKIRTRDKITQPVNLYALIPSNYVPRINYEDDEQRGVDGRIAYHNKLGKLNYKIDGNFMYREFFINKANEVTLPEDDRNWSGKMGGRILGLEADGIFETQEEIDNYVPQYFGELKPGDIKYKDYNNDGIIDARDEHEIGKRPRLWYGLNLHLNYSNFSLSVHGDGVAGGEFVDTRYWNRKTNDYPVEMENSWPVSNDLPRLTTMSNPNNYRSSTFWMKKAGYFNLRSVTFSYSLPKDLLVSKTPLKDASIYVAGKNLHVFSSVDDRYMPSGNKGYTQHPVLNAFEFGLEVSF